MSAPPYTLYIDYGETPQCPADGPQQETVTEGQSSEQEFPDPHV